MRPTPLRRLSTLYKLLDKVRVIELKNAYSSLEAIDKELARLKQVLERDGLTSRTALREGSLVEHHASRRTRLSVLESAEATNGMRPIATAVLADAVSAKLRSARELRSMERLCARTEASLLEEQTRKAQCEADERFLARKRR